MKFLSKKFKMIEWSTASKILCLLIWSEASVSIFHYHFRLAYQFICYSYATCRTTKCYFLFIVSVNIITYLFLKILMTNNKTSLSFPSVLKTLKVQSGFFFNVRICYWNFFFEVPNIFPYKRISSSFIFLFYFSSYFLCFLIEW